MAALSGPTGGRAEGLLPTPGWVRGPAAEVPHARGGGCSPHSGCMHEGGILARVTVPARGSDGPSGRSYWVKHNTINSMILILVLAVNLSDV